jgi:hypothetical protein
VQADLLFYVLLYPIPTNNVSHLVIVSQNIKHANFSTSHQSDVVSNYLCDFVSQLMLTEIDRKLVLVTSLDELLAQFSQIGEDISVAESEQEIQHVSEQLNDIASRLRSWQARLEASNFEVDCAEYCSIKFLSSKLMNCSTVSRIVSRDVDGAWRTKTRAINMKLLIMFCLTFSYVYVIQRTVQVCNRT